MMSKMNQTPHSLANTSSVLRLAFVLVMAAAGLVAQSRIIKPQQPNTNQNSGKRQHIATVRSSDSAEGSRVAIVSDQSLNDYEAYHRGDRFYVKIPAADVARAEAVHGRGFLDLKAQKSGDSTILSFRLQPGARAHVEQRANKLDVVVSLPGGGAQSVATNRTRETIPNLTSGIRAGDTNRRVGPATNSNRAPAKNSSTSSAPPKTSSAGSAKSATLNSSNKAANNSGSSSKANVNNKPTPTPQATPTAKPSPTARPSATVKPTATPSKALTATSSPAATPANLSAQTQSDWWSRMKERAHYWILLAQLNPIPVAIGAALLLLIILLLLFQRRRARATRRVRPGKIKATRSTVVEAATTTAAVSAAATTAAKEAAVESSAAAPERVAEGPAVLSAAVPVAAAADAGRKENVSRTSDEAKKLFAGEPFDEAVIGSDNRETRRLVCAELSSALVGRNAERRERAREAFMKYGYFDDATRDLRVAESENERAAAARRLSFVQDREATPHLIGALGDSAPDVRRAAVEALMDLRDPAAIPPLNSLLQTETDRKVPRNLISQAIDACATGRPEPSAPSVSQPASAVPDFVPSVPPSAPPSIETEREVIEL